MLADASAAVRLMIIAGVLLMWGGCGRIVCDRELVLSVSRSTGRVTGRCDGRGEVVLEAPRIVDERRCVP